MTIALLDICCTSLTYNIVFCECMYYSYKREGQPGSHNYVRYLQITSEVGVGNSFTRLLTQNDGEYE